MRKQNLNIAFLNCTNRPTNEFIFFEDDDLLITTSISWSGSAIKEATFKLDAKRVFKYKILDIQYCNKSSTYSDAFIIHLYKSEDLQDNLVFKSNLNNIKLNSRNDHILFLFKVHDTKLLNLLEKDLNCNLNEGTPESKDGSIIIGI
ncbi:hypothetical protein [Aquimarina rhabdastrellae]